jgi:hypothetical protein
MVNNSININKTNNRLSFQLIKHKIKQRHITLEIPDPGLGQVQTCVGVKSDNVMRSLKGCSYLST